jgi:hypothetical protein
MDTQPTTESAAAEQPIQSKAPEPESTSNSTSIINAEATTQSAPTLHPHHEADLPSPEKGAPYPPTFAEIVELITSGKPIPGIKDIPPTLLTSQATKPTASKRRKPWEKELPSEEGTFGDRRDEVIVQELPEEWAVKLMTTWKNLSEGIDESDLERRVRVYMASMFSALLYWGFMDGNGNGMGIRIPSSRAWFFKAIGTLICYELRRQFASTKLDISTPHVGSNAVGITKIGPRIPNHQNLNQELNQQYICP